MTNIQRLGRNGELLALEVLGGGVLSENQFDQDKDIILHNGETVEVKTVSRFSPKFQNLSVGENQLRKCQSVDRLIFVEYWLHESRVEVHEILDKEAIERYRVYFRQRTMKMVRWRKFKTLFSSQDEKLSKEYFQKYYSKKIYKLP